MSEEQLQGFLQRVKADPALQQQLTTISNFTELQAMGRSLGFELTQGQAGDLADQSPTELSDQELEGVTGGTIDRAILGVSVMLVNPGCLGAWAGIKVIDAIID